MKKNIVNAATLAITLILFTACNAKDVVVEHEEIELPEVLRFEHQASESVELDNNSIFLWRTDSENQSGDITHVLEISQSIESNKDRIRSIRKQMMIADHSLKKEKTSLPKEDQINQVRLEEIEKEKSKLNKKANRWQVKINKMNAKIQKTKSKRRKNSFQKRIIKYQKNLAAIQLEAFVLNQEKTEIDEKVAAVFEVRKDLFTKIESLKNEKRSLAVRKKRLQQDGNDSLIMLNELISTFRSPSSVRFHFSTDGTALASIEGDFCDDLTGLTKSKCSTENGIISDVKHDPEGDLFEFEAYQEGGTIFEFSIARSRYHNKNGYIYYQGDIRRVTTDGIVQLGVVKLSNEPKSK